MIFMSKKVTRLYKQFRPQHYQLDIVPDRKSMTFAGHVTITGHKIGRPSKRITLHQKGLKIISVKITRHGKNESVQVKISRVNIHAKYHEVRLHSDELLYPGNYSLELEFSGKVSKTMLGLYTCHFKHEGKDKMLLATQFESNHAQQVFPCIDEPEAKATFQLSITTPKNEVVLSNTMPEKQTVKGKLVKTTFETTPKMSTYLLVFVTGELHNVEAKTKAGVLVRSWGVVSRPKSHLEYSVKEAANILDFFADYFGTPYPLAKLDQVALPDFDAGAMENWGLVTYRETAMLTDPANPSISNEQFVTMVVAHELSHQWFGNLVTMKWWDDLWLNESFAGLMEHVAPAALHPDWQQWEIYTAGDVSLITSRDVYKDIQPVACDISDPDLIETLFDPAIVYAKGARLIKMLREYVGEEVFAASLKQYFTDNAYGNATRSDLWKAVAKTSHKNIDDFMTPWLTQSGMPVVHITQKGKQLKVRQERFLLDGKPDSSLWPVPLLTIKPTQPGVIGSSEATISLTNDKYTLINQFGSGQYITHYTEPNHRAHLTELFKDSKMPTEARINLLNDLYMLARHGDAPLTDSLNIIQHCSSEPRDSVWALMARCIGAASQLTEGDNFAEEQINAFKIRLALSWYKKLGWDDAADDDSNTKQLRHTIIAILVGAEHQPVIDEAIKRYKASNDLENIPAELRSITLIAAVRQLGDKVIPALLKAYVNVAPEIQQDITVALMATKKPAEAEQILGKAIGKNGFVRDQDIMRWLAMSLRNHHIREVGWKFMVDNWQWLRQTIGESKSFDYLPTYAASIVTTKEWAKRYHDFFAPKEAIKTLAHNIKLGYADVEARVAWRNREEAKLKAFFKARSKS